MTKKELPENVWTCEVPHIDLPRVFINGAIVYVQPDQDFRATLRELCKEHGLNSFTVTVDGDELLPEEAPMDFEGIQAVRVAKYDEGS